MFQTQQGTREFVYATSWGLSTRMIGALIMAFLRNGCQQMGWPNYIQEIIIGVIIVLAVALDRLRATWAERSAAAALAAEA